ncbi:insulinase family protein, partial [Patescibacteria group bacterium]|nr:insulinase family protein [Patescibacteria group bacterium]
IAEWFGKQQVLSSKIYTPEQKLKKIFAVKKDDVKKVAQEIIKREFLSLVLIGPLKDKKAFSKLLKI